MEKRKSKQNKTRSIQFPARIGQHGLEPGSRRNNALDRESCRDWGKNKCRFASCKFHIFWKTSKVKLPLNHGSNIGRFGKRGQRQKYVIKRGKPLLLTYVCRYGVVIQDLHVLKFQSQGTIAGSKCFFRFQTVRLFRRTGSMDCV